tara:strand:+ start:2279 stop:3130 length:852 start_codon:yes stop_codon:yes gene_type:complete
MFNVNNKNILITGATSGIGRESALALAKMGANITFIARNKLKAENLLTDINKISNGKNSFIIADLSSQKDIKIASDSYIDKNISLDILLNNAGLINFKRKETIDGFEETFAINHLAYFSLTNLLLDKIKESNSARIVNVSSAAHQFVKRMNFDDIQSEKSYRPFKVYGYTKLANILFTKKLSSILENTKVTVNCVHPGVVGTSFGQNNSNNLNKVLSFIARPFMLTSEKGAETSIYLCSSPDVSNISGQYFYNCKVTKTSKWAQSKEDADRLWELSKEMVRSF